MRFESLRAALAFGVVACISGTPAFATLSCGDFAELAELTEKLNQASVPLRDVLKNYSDEDKNYESMMTNMAVRAYQVTRFQTKEIRLRQERDFSDKMHLECLGGEFEPYYGPNGKIVNSKKPNAQAKTAGSKSTKVGR